MSAETAVVFVLGGPGSGKGTQCERVVERFGWAHLSAGELLRAEVATNSERARRVQMIIDEGGIVPFEITLGLIRDAMAQSAVKKFLIDGFPRAVDQAEAFERDVVPCKAMIHLHCGEDTMESRLLARGQGRSDDNPETIRKRFAVFKQTTMPVIDLFAGSGKLHTIDAERAPDAVFADVRAVIETVEAQISGGGTEAEAGPGPVSAEVNRGDDLIDLGDAPPDEVRPAGAGAARAALRVTPVVIVGPSGVGKGTLIARLMDRHRGRFGFTVSHTTRPPRPGEIEGEHYFFTTRPGMEAGISRGEFVEYAHVHGNIYGTSVSALDAVASAGRLPILDIDVQGARLVRQSRYGASSVFIFIAPPSLRVLEARLRGRGTESEDKIATRLANAEAELAASHEAGFADVVIVNDDIEDAVVELEAAIHEHAPGALSAVHTAVAHSARGAAGAQASASATDYLTTHVVPHLRSALLAVNAARPADPLQYVIDHLVEIQAGL